MIQGHQGIYKCSVTNNMLVAAIYEKLLRILKVHVLLTLALVHNVFKVAFSSVQYSTLQADYKLNVSEVVYF